MQIQIEKLYLFETNIVDPFFLGIKDGIRTTMASYKTISLLNINTAYIYIDNTAKAGLTYNIRYGGEDSGINNSLGKVNYDYELNFNFPTIRQDLAEQVVGKEFAVLAMKRDLTFIAIFGRFVCDQLKVDNEIQQRITLKSNATYARIFEVNSFNVSEITNVVNENGVTGFDYATDFGLN